MKAAVIGNGKVGMAVFRELLKLREIRELVLIGRNQEKLRAEIDDFLDAIILSIVPSAKLSFGGYDAVSGADIIVYTAGIGPTKSSVSRLENLRTDIQIARDIFSVVREYNTTAKIIVLSNPVDIITTVIQETMGVPREQVIGTGTLLDTARLKRYVSSILDVSPASFEMFVLGEHGDSACIIWSSVKILCMTLDEYLSKDVGDNVSVSHSTLLSLVKKAGWKIASGKGYTAYGVAAAAGRIVSAIINNTHEILPVSVKLEGEYGVNGIAISVPCMIGKEGVMAIKEMNLTEQEKEAFATSVRFLSETMKTAAEAPPV